MINNIFYPTSLLSSVKPKKQLLSVTIVKSHNLSEKELIERVKLELKEQCGITDCTFLKRYVILKSLPKLDNLCYQLAPSETRLTKSIFLAGDTLLNGSLNAAMMAGERAALAIVKSIQDKEH